MPAPSGVKALPMHRVASARPDAPRPAGLSQLVPIKNDGPVDFLKRLEQVEKHEEDYMHEQEKLGMRAAGKDARSRGVDSDAVLQELQGLQNDIDKARKRHGTPPDNKDASGSSL